MTSTKVGLVVLAVACLALAGAAAPLGANAATTTYSTNSTEDGHQGAEILIANSGYMVAVG